MRLVDFDELTRGTPMQRALLDAAAKSRKKLAFLDTVLAQVKRASALPLDKQAASLSWEVQRSVASSS